MAKLFQYWVNEGNSIDNVYTFLVCDLFNQQSRNNQNCLHSKMFKLETNVGHNNNSTNI